MAPEDIESNSKSILIVEDEYSLADAIAETLKKESYTTKIVTNGEDGEDEALTGIYDLILFFAFINILPSIFAHIL